MADKLDGAAIVANSLPATAIVAGSITTTQLAPSVANVVTVGSNPKIASLTYPDDDTAANTGGGQTVVINGSGFKSNVSVYINGNAVPSVTYTNANSISITTPELAAATYPLYVINTDDGGTAILIPGIQYSGTPSWVTESPLDQQQALSAWSISLSATSDSSVTYSLQAGSSLPSGISLAANGLISGTMSSPPESETTYNFTVVATDAEFQDASKAFSVSVTVVVDTQFQYTTLLLQADGTNNGNNHAFLDSSDNNFTITRNGNATQGSFSPFSPTGWSNYFPSNAYITAASNTGFAIGTTGTVEGWWYFTVDADLSGTNNKRLYCVTNNTSSLDAYIASRNIYLHGNAVSTVGTNLQPNQWYHIAIVYNSGAVSIYVNGISQTLTGTTTGYNISSTGTLVINEFLSAGYQLSGYTSNFRIVKGTAVYTSNFTPPSTPLAAIANTVLLTCQSNRFRDTQGIAIATFNSPSVQTFSPFATTTAYSPATHGGSAYFDGSGDYLTIADNAAFEMTADFTVEAWFYLNAIPGASQFADIITKGASGIYQPYYIFVNSSGSLLFYSSTNGSSWNVASGSSFGTITIGQWYHVAVSRSGSSLRMFLNGALINTITNGDALYNNSTAVAIGARSDGTEDKLNGYVCGVRLVKGTAVYTSAFTPPTSPPSNIANTSLLCNFTNAQIYDADASIVLETVGDAKVNTAIKKYGTGSIALDGTGDLLFAKNNTNFEFGTGDFTVEFWINASASGTYNQVVGTQNSNADNGAWRVGNRFNSTNVIYFARGNGTNFDEFTAPVNVNDGNWHHVAVARASGVVKMFVDGVFANSSTISGTCTSGNDLRIGYNPRDNSYVTGYIDDLRISKGLARYRYNFTPPTRAFPTKGGTQTLTADEYFDYTTLLLPGNGTNNQNNHTFLDSSNNNFTITRNGNATQGTFSPFSQTGWSYYFPNGPTGTSSVSFPDNTGFTFGSGDFTVEAWIFMTHARTGTVGGTGVDVAVIYAQCANISNNSNRSHGLQVLNNTIRFYYTTNGVSDSTVDFTTGGIPLNQWHHIAVCRSGNTLYGFINGTLISSTSFTATIFDSSANLVVGAFGGYPTSDGYTGLTFPGYISNFRITKGAALYTSSFTPSTTPLTTTVSSGTVSLLTCQSNRFVDNSANALTPSITASPSVQAFSPFAPTESYAAANVGGSGYFDGTGDYLTAANNAAFDFGSGDWTIEAWVYPKSLASPLAITSKRTSTDSDYRWLVGTINTNGTISTQVTTTGSTWGINTNTTSAVLAGQWNHIAWVRNGTDVSVYVNGVKNTLSGGFSGSVYISSEAVNIGVGGTTGSYIYAMNGYISNYRIVKGVAVYTSTFTLPTSPLTAIANTSLLCNFTNAGITDATAKTVFETIGDAKISTAQSKFGGSSIAFDGTGDRLYRDVRNERYFNLGNGGSDFTFECWVYFNSLSGCVGARGGGFAGWNSTSGHQINLGSFSGGSFYIQWWNGSTIVSNQLTNPFATGRWYHYAITLSSGTLRWFIDGIQRFSTSATIVTPSQAYYFTLGDLPSVDGAMNGYMDDVRITEGIARYTQNFALPTTAFLTK